jgi:hypothetical protein
MKKILLLHSAIVLSFSLLAQGTDPIISEYVEGWSNNKALELYNPTDNPIDLSNYRITRYSNGKTPPLTPPWNPQWYVILSGTLEPYKTKVFVIDRRNPEGQGNEAPVWDELQARADTFVCPNYNESYALSFNGDDAVALEKLDNSHIDIFGKIGQRPVNADGTNDPAGGWTDTDPFYTGVGIPLSRDHTLIRHDSIVKGVNTFVEKFNILAKWDSLPANTFTCLGWHDCSASPDSNKKPVFDSESYAFTISIEDPTGTNVGQVSATDPNGDQLSYYITKGNSYDPFLIERKTGQIKVAKTEELYWRDYTLTIDVTDGTSPVSVNVDVTVEGGYTGFRERSHTVDIHPNPSAAGLVRIGSTEAMHSIELFDLTGQMLVNRIHARGVKEMNVPLRGFKSGLYIMKIYFLDGTVAARKILVK